MSELLKVVTIASVCFGASIASADPAVRIDVGFSQSKLSGGLKDWRETSIAVSHPFDGGWAAALKVEDQERFGTRDVFSELRVDRTLTRGSFYLAVGAAPKADFRPEFALKAGGSMNLGAQAGATRLTLDADASRFASGDIYALKLGFDHAFTAEGMRGGIQAILVAESDGPALMGFVAGAELPLGPNVLGQMKYVEAPETTDGVITRVQGWTGGLRFDASDTLLLRIDVTREDRGPYIREDVAAGAAIRF